MAMYHQPITPGNFPASGDSEKFFKDFNDKVQRDWNDMCEKSRRDWQDWARRNNIENFPDFPKNAMSNFPPMQPSMQQSNWPPAPLQQDNSGCGRLIGDVQNDERGLSLALDVSAFSPEELKVCNFVQIILLAAILSSRATNLSSNDTFCLYQYT